MSERESSERIKMEADDLILELLRFFLSCSVGNVYVFVGSHGESFWRGVTAPQFSLQYAHVTFKLIFSFFFSFSV